MIDPTLPTPSPLQRRTLLKGLAVSALAVGSGSALSACTGAKEPADPGAAAAASTSVTLGSGSSAAVSRRALQAAVDLFQSTSGTTITINTVQHNDFQNTLSYLQGSPDDAFTSFAGYRMRYYAAKDLVAPIDDVWAKIGGDFPEGIAKASTGDDGKKYFVPVAHSPWGFFYRRSVWQEKGYTEPVTFDELRNLCAQMKSDGLIPIAFGNKDGWPAMGTFDYMNMRLNGYQFHVDLCAHEQSWDTPQVKSVFDNWLAILPYQDPAALGATWQEAAQTLAQKKSGMYLLGTFVTQQFSDKATLADIDFFPFPEMATEGRDAVEAPMEGYMLSSKGGDNSAARDLLAFFGSAEGQNAYESVDPPNIPTNKNADISTFSDLEKKSATVIAEAKSISQFLDRDALPAMANVMIPALQGFLKNGTIDTANLESQAKSLYAQQ